LNPTSILGKTERGRTEIADRAHSVLTRAERNLLVVADGKRCAKDILAMIGPNDAEALAGLVEKGLLEIVGEARAEVPRSAPKVQVPELDRPLPPMTGNSPFHRTYAFLSAQIPEFFGFTAFKLTLDLEKASNLSDLEPLKEKLIAAVDRKRGHGAAAAYRARLLELARDELASH